MPTAEQIANFQWGSFGDWTDIGNDHYIMPYFDENDEQVGVTETHLSPAGDWCIKALPFDTVEPKPQRWNGGQWVDAQVYHVTKKNPLSLTPAFECESCPAKGSIKNGKWVNA